MILENFSYDKGICSEIIENGSIRIISVDGYRLAIRTEKIDLIITDLHMPETNGWDILQFVRTHPHLSNIPVLAFTVDDLAIELAQLKDPGDLFDDILSKPLDEQEVVCKILKPSAHKGRYVLGRL